MCESRQKRQRPQQDADPPSNAATAYPQAQSSWKRGSFLRTGGLILAALAVAALLLAGVRPRRRKAGPSAGPSADGGMAVCYTGHLGTFAKVYQQNLNALSSLALPVKYFCVVDLHDNYLHKGRQFTTVHSEAELTALNISFEDTHFFHFTGEDGHPGDDDRQPLQDDAGHFNDVFETLHANQQCWHMVAKYERAHGIQFKWLLRLRPDMLIDVRLPPPSSSTVHLNGAAIALVPRAHAAAYFSAVEAFDADSDNDVEIEIAQNKTVCDKYAYDLTSPECFLIQWLHKHQIAPSNGVYVRRRIIYPEA